MGLVAQTSICQTTLNIVPEPVQIQMHAGSFKFGHAVNIATDQGTLHDAVMLNHYLDKFYKLTLKVKKASEVSGQTPSILLSLSRQKNPLPGEYHLEVSDSHVVINGRDPEAVFYGIQTLLQLLPPDSTAFTGGKGCELPQLAILDYPRFQYRGMHLDVGRHFFGVKDIKKFLDYLAWQKFNYFHWHLTEDQGWRIEIKRYPRLTQIGGFRNGTIIGHYPGTGNDSIHYGGFYTQAEVKEIVKYASDRYITVIPEIEMPGHSSAAIAAYPQLSCFPDQSTEVKPNTPWAGSRTGKQVQQTWGVFPDVYCPSEYTFTFLENVLDEVMKLFPSKYIHIGGDECPKTYWKRSEFCQQLIKEKHLKNEEGLQSYFISRIEKYVNSKGRQIIGWDEILEGGLAPNATVMSWRGEIGGINAAKAHHYVIMTPGKYVYFDHAQRHEEDSVTIGGYLPLDTVYNYEPVPRQLAQDEQKYVLGAQGNIWTEYMGNWNKVQYMIYPRMTALSEVLWTPKSERNWDNFKSRLPEVFQRYHLWNVNYYNPLK